MLNIKNIEVFNFENALRGMRNPLESWGQSDSDYTLTSDYILTEKNFPVYYKGYISIGEKDYDLALKLIMAGSDHSKFMRQIFITMDIIAPLYWWKEMDTYKVGTVSNSTSTMHKLGHRLLSTEDFSWDKITPYRDNTLHYLNKMITTWKQGGSKDRDLWREIIQDLPSSYNQLRTWSANYQILRNIYFARKSHKLKEWHKFCDFIESLPYSELITISKEE